jgi:integrase
MTPPSLAPLIEDYLTVRRRLGFQLDKPEALLADFARYADRIGHQGPITSELAVGWVLSSGCGRPGQAARLAAVRGFTRHRAAFDPATEVPPAGLLGSVPRRTQPHIYSDGEIAELLTQASLLSPRGGLCPRTYVTLFSLLVSTGLRLGEACRLELGDVDLADGVLTVRATKFHKSRLVPLHPTTTQALARYASHRDASRDRSRLECFFRTERAPTLTSDTVYATFSRLRQRLRWTADGRVRRPCIHDLRHTFAVRRLVRWYADGVDVDRKILALSTYLGHAGVADTYWYLSAVPELMALTSARFERFARPQEPEGTS